MEGISFARYLLLVDSTGQLFREGRSAISAATAAILDRLGTTTRPNRRSTEYAVPRSVLSRKPRTLITGRLAAEERVASASTSRRGRLGHQSFDSRRDRPAASRTLAGRPRASTHTPVAARRPKAADGSAACRAAIGCAARFVRRNCQVRARLVLRRNGFGVGSTDRRAQRFLDGHAISRMFRSLEAVTPASYSRTAQGGPRAQAW
jgi:hypothetical protein